MCPAEGRDILQKVESLQRERERARTERLLFTPTPIGVQNGRRHATRDPTSNAVAPARRGNSS